MSHLLRYQAGLGLQETHTWHEYARVLKKILQCFQHAVPARRQDSPYHAPRRKYDAAAQNPLTEDTSGKINKKRVNIIQQVIGGVLYSARSTVAVSATHRESMDKLLFMSPTLVQINLRTQEPYRFKIEYFWHAA